MKRERNSTKVFTLPHLRHKFIFLPTQGLYFLIDKSSTLLEVENKIIFSLKLLRWWRRNPHSFHFRGISIFPFSIARFLPPPASEGERVTGPSAPHSIHAGAGSVSPRSSSPATPLRTIALCPVVFPLACLWQRWRAGVMVPAWLRLMVMVLLWHWSGDGVVVMLLWVWCC